MSKKRSKEQSIIIVYDDEDEDEDKVEGEKEKKEDEDNNVSAKPNKKKSKTIGTSSAASKKNDSADQNSLEDDSEKTANKKRKSVGRTTSNDKEELRPKYGSHMESTAMNFFKNQQYGAKGIRNEMKKAANIDLRLDPDQYDEFFLMMSEEEASFYDILTEELARDWIWTGLGHSNILIYGLGDKRTLLSYYTSKYLKGEDVIELNGNIAKSHYYEASSSVWSKSIKLLLNTIAESILKDSTLTDLANGNLIYYARVLVERLNSHYGRLPSQGGNAINPSIQIGQNHDLIITEKRSRFVNRAVPKYGGRYAHVQSKLYLVIHELCGPMFDHAEAQHCLSVLVACESITLIASIELINVHLRWDSQILHRFCWKYYHLPTYIHHRLPRDHPFMKSVKVGVSNVAASENSGNALFVVLDSLTFKHKEIIVQICRGILKKWNDRKEKAKSATSSSSAGAGGKAKANNSEEDLPKAIYLEHATAIVAQHNVVRTKSELRGWLKEFIDHRIVDISQDKNGEILKILLSDEDIEKVSRINLLSR